MYTHAQHIMEREHKREPGASPSAPAPVEGLLPPQGLLAVVDSLKRRCNKPLECPPSPGGAVGFGSTMRTAEVQGPGRDSSGQHSQLSS